jgi:DMATS type aromatic prenyltransferase
VSSLSVEGVTHLSACIERAPLHTRTLGDLGGAALTRVCQAIHRGELVAAAASVFEAMSASWAGRSVTTSAWPSDLTDDASPYEFSLAFERGRPDVRLLVEAQGAQPTVHEQWRAGHLLSQTLAERFGADCTRLGRLSDLFAPTPGGSAHFALWHGVTIKPLPQASEFKVYLNPLIHGRAESFRVVHEALRRLGLPDSAAFLREAERTCGGRAWPVYFSVDMAAGESSRAKVYLAHGQAEIDDASALMARSNNAAAQDVQDWCDAIVGDQVRFTERPLLTCFSFTARDPRPCGTLHIPARCYVANDQVLFERVRSLLDDVAGELYRSAVRALVDRPLVGVRGFQTYVSLRRVQGLPRATIYLAPQAYTPDE